MTLCVHETLSSAHFNSLHSVDVCVELETAENESYANFQTAKILTIHPVKLFDSGNTGSFQL